MFTLSLSSSLSSDLSAWSSSLRVLECNPSLSSGTTRYLFFSTIQFSFVKCKIARVFNVSSNFRNYLRKLTGDKHFFQITLYQRTLPRGEILRIVQVKTVQAASARFPPPATFEHRGAVQRRSVVIPAKSHIYRSISDISVWWHHAMTQEDTASEFQYENAQIDVQLMGIISPVVRGKRAIVRSVPRIVQGISSVSFVSVYFQFVIFSLRIDFEVRILRVSKRDKNELYI